MPDKLFTWIKTYRAIADAVARREDDQSELLELFEELTGGIRRESIDPFTFFTAFNRGVVIIDRYPMITAITEKLGIDVQLPTDFLGIPTANHELWQYFDSSEQGVAECWRLFDLALAYADGTREVAAEELGEAFDAVHAQENITKANLTRALYWVRPESFLPLGGKTREFLHDRYGMNPPYSLSGMQYLRLLEEAHAVLDEPFYAVSAKAYRTAHADSWWPLERDYDPHVHEEQWVVLLQDPAIASDDAKLALKRMLELGGQATPEELVYEYGKDGDFYRSSLQDFSKAACARLGQEGYKGSSWPIALLGQTADENRRGDYVWKLRPEIAAALKTVLAL